MVVHMTQHMSVHMIDHMTVRMSMGGGACACALTETSAMFIYTRPVMLVRCNATLFSPYKDIQLCTYVCACDRTLQSAYDCAYECGWVRMCM